MTPEEMDGEYEDQMAAKIREALTTKGYTLVQLEERKRVTKDKGEERRKE